MSTITEHMTHDHRRCDELFSDTEIAVSNGDWSAADAAWQAFHQAIDRHLNCEEQVLFPAFEQASGGAGGPTTVMRMEHQQMRQLFDHIDQAIREQAADTVLGLTETLMMLMQQHNMKEEQILYPMSQQVLPDAAATLQAMQAS